MSENAQGLYVPRHYEMDPEFEDVIYGTDLREGMIVLLEDVMFRGDPERMQEPWERHRVREVNRWCTVTQLQVIPRPESGSPLIKFMAVYADGTKAPRAYDASYAWIVKRESSDGTA